METKKITVIESFVHDIRNKLAIAQGKLHKIRNNPKATQNDLDTAETAINTALELVKALATSTSEENIDVAEEINSMAPPVFAQLEKLYGVDTAFGKMESAEQSAKLGITKAAMIRIMYNIYENSSKAGATKIEINDRIENGFCISTFQDNGKGCATPEVIGTGWTGCVGGTGVGTKSAKEYMETIGGGITWTSTEKGMAVTMVIPLEK